MHAGRIGDRALHVAEVTPDLETNWHVEDDFIAAVKSRGRINPHPDFEDGVRYMRVVQAVADSRSAQRVGRDRGDGLTIRFRLGAKQDCYNIAPRMMRSAMLK